MKNYVKPMMESEVFAANEYIAACYNIACNVPTGFGFIDNNGNDRYDRNIDTKLTDDGVYGCGTVHEGVPGVPDDGPVANAMWQPQEWRGGIIWGEYVNDGPAYDVYYWRDGSGRLDIHFSRVSDANWEPNPNAS